MLYRIIRHAQTDANRAGALSCSETEPLNRQGLKQADQLSAYLATLHFDAVWISPFPRALQSIQPFITANHIDYTVCPELAEGCMNLDHQAPIADDWRTGPHELSNFRARVASTVNRMRTHNGPGTILMVTHGHFIRELINMLLQAQAYARWPVDNCSETAIDINDTVRVLHVNKRVIPGAH